MRTMSRALARSIVERMLCETDEAHRVVLWKSAWGAIGALRRRNRRGRRGDDFKLAEELAYRLSNAVWDTGY
jgi:hypothetical protein